MRVSDEERREREGLDCKGVAVQKDMLVFALI